MRALAVLRATTGPGGVTRIAELRGQVPLLPRVVAAPGPGAEVMFVGGAAGPLGGDELEIRVHVDAGARLTVRTAAAAVVLPGGGGAARQRIVLEVADGGELAWLPEPVVVASGARVETTLSVTLGRAARLLLRETVVLGRTGERGGGALTRWRADAEGRPVLRQHTAFGPGAHPGWDGPAGTAGGTVVATELRLPRPPGDVAPSVPGRAVCELAAGGLLTTVVAADAPEAARLLAARPAPERMPGAARVPGAGHGPGGQPLAGDGPVPGDGPGPAPVLRLVPPPLGAVSR